MGSLRYGPGPEQLATPPAEVGLPPAAAAARPLALPAADGGQELVAVDPDLADPRIAAARYRALLGELETARAMLDERQQAGRAEVVAQAQRHRDAATVIRTKVDEAWQHVAAPMAHHGIEDLDDVRSPAAGAAPATDEDHRRPVAHAKRRAVRRDDKRLPARAGTVRPTAMAAMAVDPARAPQDAYQLCLEAMTSAAELRAVSRGGTPVPAGMVTAAACIFVGALAALARVFADVAAFGCLGVGAILGWLAVTSMTDAGKGAALRAGLVAAGSAGVVVLATIRFTPSDPAGVVASVVVIALAIRFGLGIGASQPVESTSKTRGGGTGRKRTW